MKIDIINGGARVAKHLSLICRSNDLLCVLSFAFVFVALSKAANKLPCMHLVEYFKFIFIDGCESSSTGSVVCGCVRVAVSTIKSSSGWVPFGRGGRSRGCGANRALCVCVMSH